MAQIICRDLETFDEDGVSDTYIAKVHLRSENELVIDVLEKAGVKSAWIGLVMGGKDTGDHKWYGQWFTNNDAIDETYLAQEEHQGQYPWAPDEP